MVKFGALLYCFQRPTLESEASKDMLHFLLYFLLVVEVVARNGRIVGRDVPLRASYDFVIIGGGTSGLTVADRLTENPKSPFYVTITCRRLTYVLR